jgi:PiT family inorganic phosphate transporter
MIGLETLLLFVAALAFAAGSGASDGSTLVAGSTRTNALTPLASMSILVVLVGLGPALVGTAVATTFAHRLVMFEGQGGKTALLMAVLAALVVVFDLTRRGFPTSLTLALIGGIVGAGLGSRLPVNWGVVGQALASGVLAPFASIAVAYVVSRAVARLPRRVTAGRSARHLERAGFLAQAVAYSANDAQKLVAILAVAAGASLNPVPVRAGPQLLVAVGFAVGTLLAIRRVGRRISDRIVRVRSANNIAAEFSAALVVFTSSALGMPVSSTQVATTAVVGTGITGGARRIRWDEAANIGLAWVLTLPASIALAFLVSGAVRLLR